MLAALFEIVLGFIGEILLELIVEVAIEFGFYFFFERLITPSRYPAVIETIGYVLVGAMLGGASVLIFPNSFIPNAKLQIANLFITPILAGAAMMGVGTLRTRKGQNPIRLDSFTFGALFAFSLELVRFLFVQ